MIKKLNLMLAMMMMMMMMMKKLNSYKTQSFSPPFSPPQNAPTHPQSQPNSLRTGIHHCKFSQPLYKNRAQKYGYGTHRPSCSLPKRSPYKSPPSYRGHLGNTRVAHRPKSHPTARRISGSACR